MPTRVMKQDVRRKFEGNRVAVTCVAVAPDGKSGVTGGADTTAQVWHLTKSIRRDRWAQIVIKIMHRRN